MISIIIPTYKSEETIKQCINSINNSSFNDFETIIIDGRNGAGTARNIGAKKAKGDILLFLDSDIVIYLDTLEKINKSFKKNISALQTMYSRKCPINDFFSQYQNLCQHYIFFSIKSKYVHTAGTYCFAIRKKDFINFKNLRTCEDGEWGSRLYQNRKKILLDKNIQVKHLKKYSFRKLLKRSFIMSSDKIKSIKNNRSQINVNFESTPHDKTKMLSILFSIIPPIFWYLNKDFFRFVYKEKGKIFLFKTILFHELNCFVFLMGIMKGAVC